MRKSVSPYENEDFYPLYDSRPSGIVYIEIYRERMTSFGVIQERISNKELVSGGKASGLVYTNKKSEKGFAAWH
jgi:hypothetical protein